MHDRFRPAFNAAVYGPAEARAQKYWDKRLKRGGEPCGERKVSKVANRRR